MFNGRFNCISFLCFFGPGIRDNKNNVVDVKDLLPQSVIDNYKGSFNSIDELLASADITIRTIDPEDYPDGFEGIKVNNVDELAALVLSSKNQISEQLGTANPYDTQADFSIAGSNVVTHDYTIGDFYTYWVKLYATITYDVGKYPQDREITSLSANTQLHGFTLGVSWQQGNVTSIKTSATTYKSTANGTLSLNIIIEGIGKVIDVPVSGSTTGGI